MIVTEIDLETIKHRDYVSVKCNFCKEIRKITYANALRYNPFHICMTCSRSKLRKKDSPQNSKLVKNYDHFITCWYKLLFKDEMTTKEIKKTTNEMEKALTNFRENNGVLASDLYGKNNDSHLRK